MFLTLLNYVVRNHSSLLQKKTITYLSLMFPFFFSQVIKKRFKYFKCALTLLIITHLLDWRSSGSVKDESCISEGFPGERYFKVFLLFWSIADSIYNFGFIWNIFKILFVENKPFRRIGEYWLLNTKNY